ncbi:MAG: PKD domain-containing protein [Owenweeksia sp.]|nr:PKD domain-containing protein [Owenweeksia sp.]
MNFNSLGQYTVIAQASNLCGIAQDTMNLSFATSPSLPQIPDTLVCPHADYHRVLSASGGTAPYTYNWVIPPEEAGDPVISGDTTIHILNITSAKTVYVTITDSLGCTTNQSFTINVSDLDVDAGTDQVLCPGDTAYLNGFISGGTAPHSFYWTPGENLSDSTSLTPYYYGTAISQNLVLHVTDSLGCRNADTVNISIDTTNPVDAGPDISMCLEPTLYDLSNQGTSGGTWNGPAVSGGQFDPMLAGLGSHLLYYQHQNASGCPFTDSMTITVISGPVANFGLSAPGCSPLSVNVYDSATAGVNHSWKINDSIWSTDPNPSFNFWNSGVNDSIIAIELIITTASGCADSITKSISVYPTPVIDFSLPAVLCATDSLTLNASSNISSTQFKWAVSSPTVPVSNDSAANPTFSFPRFQTGYDSLYTITLWGSNGNGCGDTVSKVINIPSAPIARFSLPAAQCSPAIISPADNSLGDSLSYSWSVSPAGTIVNGNTAAPSINLPVSVSDSVTYTIGLTVTNASGCTDTFSTPYTVYPKPEASFDILGADSCAIAMLSFNNLSSPNQSGMDGSDLSYAWEFSNGQTSTNPNPTVTFTNNGVTDSVYVISLVVTNPFGCTDTTKDSIVVHPLPQSRFGNLQSAICAPFTIDSAAVNVSSFNTANGNYYWQVLATDGSLLSQDTGLNALSYHLPLPGDSAMVRLIVASPYGCVNDTSEQLFYTIDDLLVDFTATPDSSCSPVQIQIADSSTVGAQRDWYVNNLHFHSGTNPNFNFSNTSHTQDSILDIKLVLTSGQGCSDSLTRRVVVKPLPIASFVIPAEICPGTTIQPNDSSQAPASASYQWYSSSPSVQISNDTAHAPTLSFPPNQSGSDSTYTISLVIDANGCIDSIARQVTLYSRPIARFSLPDAACGPTIINPYDSSQGSKLVYQWSVPSTVSIQGATHHTPTFSFPVSNQIP